MDAPLLLTPGPLTTHPDTRAAMSRDWGSRDPAFTALNARLRARLLEIAGVDPAAFACVPLQGSGTFAVEATLGTLVPRGGRCLVLVNGAYGERALEILRYAGRQGVALRSSEEAPVDPAALDRALADDPAISHVVAVHCETTTGVLNPLAELAAVTAARGRRLIIDAMSAFGAIPLSGPFEAVVASSNKCLEGAPGFGFVIARRAALEAAGGNAHALSLDLAAQHMRFLKDGQWRFTPPTHALAALDRALALHAEEGGVAGRGGRYRESCRVLVAGMRSLGFEPLLPDAVQAPIILTFLAPASLAWDFEAFYAALGARGFSIYPGKLTRRATFRVGCIGQVFPEDLRRFTGAVAEVMGEMGIASGAP